MAILLADRPIFRLEEVEEPPDICHWTCHCTDDKWAACGEYVGEEEMVEDDVDESLECVVCRDLWWSDTKKCPWGCTCAVECASNPAPY